jgi:nucleoside-diphosphate-sugar epimerase
MKVFVAGATGVIGRPLVRELVAAGHDVVGMTRTPAKANDITAMGARPVVCDALDREAVAAAVSEARPDVVIHQLTALPTKYNPRRIRRTYRETDRLHREGTDHLLAAALSAGAKRFVVQSIAFSYQRTGGPVKAENAPLDPSPPKAMVDSSAGIVHLENAAAAATGIDTVVLRYGFFYGPGTWYAPDGHFAKEVRARRFPVVGDGQGVFSFVHVADAAAATRLAVDSDVTGAFNIVDDEPAAQADWLPVFAEAVGAPKPWRAPKWLARVASGSSAVEQLTTLRGADNSKAKSRLGWTLQYPSWRTGFARQTDG